MNSTTTTPATLRQLAINAHTEREERKRPERDAYRHHKTLSFRRDLCHLLGETATRSTYKEQWNEKDESPEIIIDDLIFVRAYSPEGIAVEFHDTGARHRIESLADLGALLAQAEDAPDPEDKWEKRARIFSKVSRMTTDELAAELQDFTPKSLPLAPPISETHPDDDDEPGTCPRCGLER